MKRFVWVTLQVSILLMGPVLATVVRADSPGIDSSPAVIELKGIDVHFQVKVFGLARIVGRFDRLRGELISGADGKGSDVRMHIDVDSVTTDDAWRDDYLRGPTFFRAERYPHITFSGSCLSRGDNGPGRIVGDLSLHGATKRVVFEVREVSVPEGGSARGYQATATIRRSEFGLTRLQHIVSDEVEIIVAMNTEY